MSVHVGSLVFWVLQAIGLVVMVVDVGCLIYAGTSLIPSGDLFGAALSAKKQAEAYFFLWVCAGLVVAPPVACLVALFSRKTANYILWTWYGYAITYGDNHAVLALTVLHYLQVQLPLAGLKILTPQAFVLPGDDLPHSTYWWWFGRVTFFLFICWWFANVTEFSAEAIEDEEDCEAIQRPENKEQVQPVNGNDTAVTKKDETPDNVVVPMYDEVGQDDGNNSVFLSTTECSNQQGHDGFVSIDIGNESSSSDEQDGNKQQEGRRGSKKRTPHLKWFLLYSRVRSIFRSKKVIKELAAFVSNIRLSYLFRRE